MTLTFLSCPEPIRHPLQQFPRPYPTRDSALEHFQNGRTMASIAQALAFALPTQWGGRGEDDVARLATQPFVFHHGTARIELSIVNGELRAVSRVAHLPLAGRSTAALRHMLTEATGTGQFHQPRLVDNVLLLAFAARIDRLHPLRLIEAIERLAVEADRHDHWMVAQFGVEMHDRAPIQALTDEEQSRALAIWDGHWLAMEALVADIRRRRSMLLLDAVASLAHGHLRYLLPIYGDVRRALEDDELIYGDRHDSPDRRDAALAKAAKSMRALQHERLCASCGHVQTAVPPVAPERAPRIGNVFDGELWSNIVNARATGRMMDVTLALAGGLVTLLTRNTWPPEIAAEFRRGLDLIHELPWRDAAEALFAHVGRVRREWGEGDRAAVNDDMDAAADAQADGSFADPSPHGEFHHA